MAPLIVFTFAVAATLSAALVVAMMPLLRRYALARPNARSSHAMPTPQGAGVAVMLATILATAAALGLRGLRARDVSPGRDRAGGGASSRGHGGVR